MRSRPGVPLTLFETSAIARYVDGAFPGPKLMPDTPADRARAEQWISTVHCYCYDAMVSRCLLQYVFPRGADGKPDRAAIDAAIPQMKAQFAILESAYGARDFLVGDRPTIADLILAPIVFYLLATPESAKILEAFTALRRAHAAVAGRSSFTMTMPPR